MATEAELTKIIAQLQDKITVLIAENLVLKQRLGMWDDTPNFSGMSQ